MVSGVTDIQTYNSNKGYYSSPPSQTPSTLSGKRFSDTAMRPWPPMYRSPASRAQMATYQAMSVSSAKLNYTNNFNANHYNNSNSSIYGRTKFNFQQFNIAAAAAANNKYASTTNGKNAKNYYLVSQPYVKNQLMMPNGGGSFYGHTTEFNNNANGNQNNTNNVLMMADKEKNRFRKLRNPSTTTPPVRSSCACIRSKSMEDVRTEIVTDWATYNKENYNEFKKNRLNNGGGVGLMKQAAGTRRSMDNLLEVDANFVKQRFQVGNFSFALGFFFSLSCHEMMWRLMVFFAANRLRAGNSLTFICAIELKKSPVNGDFYPVCAYYLHIIHSLLMVDHMARQPTTDRIAWKKCWFRWFGENHFFCCNTICCCFMPHK